MAALPQRRGFDPDWLLATLATLIAGGAFTLLLTGAQARVRGDTGPSIATLTSAVQEVRRRASGTLVWEELQQGAPLALGDVLFVPPSSGATVAFADGSRMELGENTFVALEPSGDRRATPKVRLDRGLVLGEAGAGGGLNIQTGAGIARLERGAQARVSRSDDQGARVDVLEGTAALDDGTKVAAHETAIPQGDGWARSAWPVRLSAPEPLARIYFSGAAPQPVALKWSAAGEPGARLQVFDRGGERIFEADAASGEASFRAPGSGSYDWRIAGADGRPRSETRRVSVVRDVPPVPLSPRRQELIPGYLGRKVPFGWSNVPGVRRYVVEVADGPEFSQVRWTQEVTGTSLRVAWTLGEGTFFWRVRSLEPAIRGESPWSVPGQFRYLEKPLPEAPEIIDSRLEVDP